MEVCIIEYIIYPMENPIIKEEEWEPNKTRNII